MGLHTAPLTEPPPPTDDEVKKDILGRAGKEQGLEGQHTGGQDTSTIGSVSSNVGVSTGESVDGEEKLKTE